MARNPFHNSDSSGDSGGAMVLDPETGEMIAAPSGGGADGSNAMSDGLHDSSSSSSSAQVGIPAVCVLFVTVVIGN